MDIHINFLSELQPYIPWALEVYPPAAGCLRRVDLGMMLHSSLRIGRTYLAEGSEAPDILSVDSEGQHRLQVGTSPPLR